MASRRMTAARLGWGFTLIELLVVIAIISLMIAILLPSLGTARAQARATVCASRLAQLTKAMLLYADDFNETPPFIAVGYKNCGETDHYNNLDTDPSHDEVWFAGQEKWLIPNMTEVWLDPDWEALRGTPREAKVQNGTLWGYARFETLYRCPDFERQPGRTQKVFNYSRNILGRKILSSAIGDPDAREDNGAPDVLHPGPIMKVSNVYAPSSMFMMLDEQWDFHCAGRYNDRGIAGLSGFPMAAETIHALVGDMIGSYHGTLTKAILWPELQPDMSGNIGYYDGHVAPYQDPWPWRTASDGVTLGNLLMRALADPANGKKCLDPLLMSVYAQRGVPLTDEMLVEIIRQIGVQ